MAAWEAAQAAQEAHDDETELEAAAGSEGEPAHTRTVRLSPWAARFRRTRPMVEARTYDGKPLIEHHLFDRHGAVDLAAREKDRASKRLRSDGAGPPPAREAAIRGDNARRASSHGAASATAASQRQPVADAMARSLPHPSGNLENGKPQHVLPESLMVAVQRAHGRTLRPRANGPDVQHVVIRAEPDARVDSGEPVADIFYVRATSAEWESPSVAAATAAAIDGTVQRALSRGSGGGGNDNADVASDPSGGAYVNHGATVLWQHLRSRSVRALVDASSAAFKQRLAQLIALVSPERGAEAAAKLAAEEEDLVDYERARNATKAANEEAARAAAGFEPSDLISRHVYGKRYGAPYRHQNGTRPEVQRLCEANAVVMGAAARVVAKHAPEVMEALWAPVRAAPVVAPMTVYPTPTQQQGRAQREWDVRDGLPADGDDAAFPTGHLASRAGGLPDRARDLSQPEQTGILLTLMACGVSNLHIDRADSPRTFGVPIVYVPRISDAARADPRYDPRHPCPSTDIVIAENGCSAAEGGGRVVRVVTCVEGWVCIAFAHYERCLHGGVYPTGPCGGIVDPASGRPYLEQQLVPGVELLRCVLYQMARVDDFNFAVQAEYETRADGSGSSEPNERQRALLLDVYLSLNAPLDERLAMLHPWLPQKEQGPESEKPFGDRGRWR